MSLLLKLPHILDECKNEYHEILSGDFSISEMIGHGENILANSDNLSFMKYLKDKHNLAGKLNLIYIDPPFYSKANYDINIKLQSDKIDKIPVMKQKAYHDVWEDGMEEYIRMLAIRFYMMKDLLAEDGCIWVHLDWHVVHYVKIIMDEIFGEKNFINEIIWNYKSGGVSKNYFARKHDTLLFYVKSPNYYFKPQQEKSYNREFKPYRFKGVKEYKDDIGWYTMVNMKDVWQINMVGRTSAERTGYATQKPEQLIERILESCTREGDLCADFFGGSGTLAAAANKMNRKWISCDIGKLSTVNAHKRMVDIATGGYILYEESKKTGNRGNIDVECDLHTLEVSDKIKLAVLLKGYQPGSYEDFDVEDKYKPMLEKLVKEDSLQLIDYWSVDFQYNDIEFKPQKSFYRKNNLNLEFSCSSIADEFHTIGIKVIDIFGCSVFKIIKIKGG